MTTPTTQSHHGIGAGLERADGVAKVTGTARYAFEFPVANPLYAWPVQSTIACGTVTSVDFSQALAEPGVTAVLDHRTAPRLIPGEYPALSVLQSSEVSYRGEIVAAVVADSLETAREAAALVRVHYAAEQPRVILSPDDPAVYCPETVNAGFAGSVVKGDVEAALAASPVLLDATYTTPAEHPSPMEPHATIAVWNGPAALTLYDANQGPVVTAGIVAPLFGLETADVRVITDFVGGGFGSKLVPNPPTILAVLAAKVTRRPVKIALTRQQMFTLIPHRTPTIQRVRLGATLDGRLTAIDHDALQHCSILAEYCEQTVTGTRVMYPAPAMRTVHRLARLNVPPPAWMRAPGEAPGMFALESAMDELAVKLAMDPVELRIRNDTSAEPASGLPFSSRSLARCLREGARRFGWADRDPKPGARRDGRWLTGTGVASATYPVYLAGSSASARADADGTFTIRIAAVDIGTGARTALAQIAATALRVPVEQVRLELGHSDMPAAPWAGGSLGTASWGWAVTRACEALLRDIRERDGAVPAAGLEAVADTTAELERQRRYARHSFGAHFAQVRVDSVTGTVRLDRLLGVFAAGRIINPRLARSQLLGGMIMGASTALHEALELDPQDGDYANHDLASYHFAAHADIQGVEAVILEENDFDVNLLGVKGVGELGIVGTAAAIANAVYHATGTRVRDLPLTLERTCPVER